MKHQLRTTFSFTSRSIAKTGVLALLMLAALGIGGRAVAQVPLITDSVAPSSVAPGGSAFLLTVNGNGFTSSSVVQWNGAPLPTHFKSSHRITATVGAHRIAIPGTAWITVKNPAADLSNTIHLPIVAPFAEVHVSRSDYNVGPSSVQAVLGDFNHDRKLDAAVLDYADGTVSVLLGNGHGAFSVLAGQTPFPSNTLYSVAIGDFDGDGNDDLAVLTNDPSTGPYAAILLGNGDGTFTPGVPTYVRVDPHANPAQVIAGDFNGDGKLDIAISDQQGERIFVLAGDGAGNLAQPVITPIALPGFNPVWMAVGDFNGDGILDLAVTEPGPSYLDILLGNGDGTFSQSQIPFAPGTIPTQVIAADFNHDGKVDLAVTNGGNIFIFIGNGDGTFRALPKLPVLQGDAASITAGDFNGDGKLDLAMCSDIYVSILPGNGDGSFGAPWTFASPAGSGWIVASDFNNDGRLDLLDLTGSSSAASVYLQIP